MSSGSATHPNDDEHLKVSGSRLTEKRLSLQMGDVMVNFEVADGDQCQEDVTEDKLMSGYKVESSYDESSEENEAQSPNPSARRKSESMSKEELDELLKEHQEIVNKVKVQERRLSGEGDALA